jgi:hypothetical protein
MKNLYKTFFLALLLQFASCNTSGSNDNIVASSSIDNYTEASISEQPLKVERKLIKEGSIAFEVNNLQEYKQDLLQKIKDVEAYISSDREYNSEYELSNTLIIRVPAANFDVFVENITQGINKIDYKNITIKDVTEEFLDIETRLKTKKELEKKYLELLNKANSVKDILDVEQQIGNLRTEIESIEGRLNYLKNTIAFSTLTLRIYQTLSPKNEFGSKFIDGFGEGWENLILFFISLTHIWPFIILFILFILYMRYLRNKKNKEISKK